MNGSAVKIYLSALTPLLLSACSHPLPLVPSQKATISSEAADFIERSSYRSLPDFVPIKPAQIVKGRDEFNRLEAPHEDALIAKYGLRTEMTKIAGVPVMVIRPRQVRPGLEDAVALNIHGGGFMIGSARDRSALMVAGSLGITVYSIEYTMAPEAKYPVAINQSLAVYHALIQRVGAGRMIGVSSSAGGQIMLAMLMRAHRQGLPMMRAQVLFTPAADVSGDGDSAQANNGRDVVALGPTLRTIREFYLGGADPRDPAVSPIYDNFPANFPASVMVSGTRDLLLSNAVRLSWKLKEASVPAELLVAEGGWHGFHWEYETPESKATMRAVTAFLLGHLSAAMADTNVH
ncbi:alpha/beta hydrolase [Herbaspirillum frisingense]|uniref:alpha/beta hydrolase n=1 Tax=Herbaspirillum frisingense TaxID=92645 RepID=UPI0016009D07|nr:alpha/beta hydrolase [Herbaspirillum frisingense]QNB05863.1 alpha/beta hydrolase [Herbaspirillum frisingense]